MDDICAETPFSDLAQLVPGDNPTNAQLKSLVKPFLRQDFSTIPATAMYPALCAALNAVCTAAKSDYWFKDVGNRLRSSCVGGQPDLAMYSKKARDRAFYTFTKAEKLKVPPERRIHLARCSWENMVAFVECKQDEAESAFCHSGTSKFLHTSDDGFQCQTHIAVYAAQIQTLQHRTHVRSLYFTGPYMRVQRWDRAGCLVSTAINFQEEPVELVKFLYRFVRLSGERLGHDPSAVLATPKEIKMLVDYRSNNARLRAHRRRILEAQDEFPIYKITIPTYTDESSGEGGRDNRQQTRSATSKAASLTSQTARPTRLKTYLVGEPVEHYVTPVGRATKAFIALDMESREMVFIKDQWRAVSPDTHSELDTYERLRKNNVSCVATCLGGSDVFTEDGTVQHTLTHSFLTPSSSVDNSERFHTRLILKEIGVPLSEYPNSVELIVMVYHALIGHCEAWEQAGVLHCDISAANIMIAVDAPPDNLMGFLTDWDVCKYREDLENDAPASPGRFGTWATLSVLSLQYPKKPQEVADDLESAMYVLVQMALRFHQHSRTPLLSTSDPAQEDVLWANGMNRSLALFVTGFFDIRLECEEGYWCGGETKQDWLGGSSIPVDLLPGPDKHATPLARLLADLYRLLRRHYAAINYDDQKRFKVSRKSCLPAVKKPVTPTSSDIPSQNAPRPKNPLSRLKSRRVRLLAEASSTTEDCLSDSSSPQLLHSYSNDQIRFRLVKDPKRVLDIHDEILKTFERVLYEDRVKLIPRDLSQYMDDKWFDQFEGLGSGLVEASGSGFSDRHPELKRKAFEETRERLGKRMRA